MAKNAQAVHQTITPDKSSAAPNGLLQRKCACGGTPGPSGECAACRAKRLGLQRAAAQATTPAETGQSVPPIVHDVLRSPGQPLDSATRAFMEPRFGHDFSRVRVHTDAKAIDSAESVGAHAYTVGQDLVFGTGQYAPKTLAGKRLLAHELTHVMQQSQSNAPALQRQGGEVEDEAARAGEEFRSERRRDLGRIIEDMRFRKIRVDCPRDGGVRLLDVLRGIRSQVGASQPCQRFFQTNFGFGPERLFSPTARPSLTVTPTRELGVSGRTRCPEPAVLIREDVCGSSLRGRVIMHELIHFAGCLTRSGVPAPEDLVHQGTDICMGTVQQVLDAARQVAERQQSTPQPVQPKLMLNQPGDPFEQEADTLAEQVVSAESPNLFQRVNTAPLRLQQTVRPQVQRTLAVNPNHPPFAPATDPAAALTPAQRFAMMDTLIQGLCDQFEVNGNSGEVVTTSLQSLDPAALALSSKPTGCCCLNVLTTAATPWTIQVSQVIGPRNLGGQQIVLSPTNTPVDFGSFTSTGNLAFQGAIPAAGHEICGHAALEELSIHPPGQNRTTTDVHDPTVRIENLISGEQGVPSADLRGLAASGPHRGESVDRITLRHYPLNRSDVASLPAPEQDKLRFAAAYIQINQSFVDVLGHSDAVGSPAAKQSVSDQRALRARDALLAEGVPATIQGPNLLPVARFTRVEGVSDTQPPPPPLDAQPENWRRVELLIAGFPAGAQRPPSGTPTVVSPHIRSPNLPAARASLDPCIQHLARGAYP